ncbi:MAG TPA: BREX system P-loop protein BrxC [Nitrospirae bacterium]|nr:BREX system P-loop protein BrxC [Nitrospirota bacterium]
MHIRDIFTKDLFRPINGVVKADQQDEAVIWQELDEYVITHELDGHFRKFFSVYLDAVDNPKDPVLTDRIGVWVSGFFGSGKSHFIKILSYLLRNRMAHEPDTGTERKASDFLDPKIDDPMLLGDIKRAVKGDTDVVLFNIDSKATHKEGRDAMLDVSLRVFNEMQGFSGDYPHIAELERYLGENGVLDNFHNLFKEVSGKEWKKERDAHSLWRDEVILALSKALGKSEDNVADWYDKSEETFSITIEKFAKQVKQYLDSKGPAHRIIFLVDEVGQFIGQDTHLMLSLQTIVEDLGRICNGRAWVIVTSQEDIDAVIGEVRGSKANDFSKIQGRFYTRLSLSSSNTDEVIQARLLEKTGDARRALEDLYEDKGDILRNQISFTGGATLKNYNDKEDFVNIYPFAPYHFQLLQKIFESIRKAGATGLHLSRGERSMLDAFQSAAQSISDKGLNNLVPLYKFYPSIESFLDTSIKRTIEQAEDNSGLRAFDVDLLRSLFLIRYVDIVKPNIDNLVTLFIHEVDADRLEIKRNIEESLQRLEKETLINRNGDLYYFLTNEERDVSREIKNVEIESNQETKLLSEIIFDEVLKGDRKYRYQLNRKDYEFNRYCDGLAQGSVTQELSVEVITPLHEEFISFNKAKCINHSALDGGKALIKMTESAGSTELIQELRTYLQTEKYVRLKMDASAPDSLKTILRDRAEENRNRKGRLTALLEKLFVEADFYALGQSLEHQSTTPRTALANAVNYLVENIYTKLSYLKVLQDEPQKEIRAVLLTDDIGQHTLGLETEDGNYKAIQEVKDFIDLSSQQNHRIALNQLIDRFSSRPYGWPDWEISLLIARLFMSGNISLKMEGAAIQPKEAIDPLTKSVKWKQITILKRKAVGDQELSESKKISQQVFGKIGPDSEDGLYKFIREFLTDRHIELKGYKHLADTGNYPGAKEINAGIDRIAKLLAVRENFEFFQSFIQAKDELLDLSDDMHELKDFYENQKPAWEKLRKAMYEDFVPNRQELESDETARKALARIDEILKAPRPYGMLKEVNGLISSIAEVKTSLLEKRRNDALAPVDKKIDQIKDLLDKHNASSDLRNRALKPLQDIKKQIQQEKSIPNIFYLTDKANTEFDNAITLIESEVEEKEAKAVVKVRPSSITGIKYLESEDDVDKFLGELKKALMDALKDDKRIRIE